VDRFRFSDHGFGRFFCRQCGGGDGLKLLMMARGISFPEAARLVETVIGEDSSPNAKADAGTSAHKPRDPLRSWREASSIAPGSTVDVYLKSRAITLAEAERRSLRSHPALFHWPTKTKWPAIVALVRLADGTEVTCHQTFLDLDGSGKAPLEKARLFPAGIAPAGGVWFGVADPESEFIVAEGIAYATGIGIRTVRATLKTLKEKAAKEKEAAEAQERARRSTEYAARRQQAQHEERRRLWQSCAMIAESPVLLKGMEAVAHQAGVVGEDAAIRALYLTYTSRFLDGEAARVLRLGASASGKNLVVEKTLQFIPRHAVVQISGSSPKSLPYYGGDDPDALKHKVVYIPEAVILAKKSGEADNDFTTMLRTLISEGRLVYQTVVVYPDGRRETETIVKNGPIVAILTTARDVDHELKTRCLVQDTDESGAQTAAIVERDLSDFDEAPLNLEAWLDFQLWLEIDAPYRVRIPFKKAIFEAFKQWRPGFLETVSMRMRRDVRSFLSVVKASAVLHKAQREIADDGAIVATLDDYRHAHEAFDEGLATVHGKASEKVIAVVEAVEEMSGDAELSVKVTLRELAMKLRIASLKTAGARLMAAVDCGALEQDDVLSGPGGARYFRVIRKAADMRAEPGLGVFPPPDVVRVCISEDIPSGNEGTKGTKPDDRAKARI
jgi:hypothetical protein